MKKITIVLAVLLLFVILSVIWWKNGVSAVNTSDKRIQVFVVGPHESVREISNRLKSKGLIKDPVIFYFLVNYFLNTAQKIQAGDHRLSPSMTAREVAKNLILASNDVWITIPEGLRADEIADILEKDVPSYKSSWRKILEQNEGYLFPDTYLISKDSEIDILLKIFKNNFENKFLTIDTSGSKFSKGDIVNIASLVEREAKFAEDRTIVSSVIHNRLEKGIKLDIDATVQYALGYQDDQKRWWKKGLTIEDTKIQSPYNTYRNAGLPPTPISNPGLAALKTSVNPAQTNYLYYISDKTGKNHYAETIEEHNANIKKYGL